MVLDPIANQNRFYANWNLAPELLKAYNENYHADNPLNEGGQRFDVGEPFNVPMLMETGRWLESRVYREFGRPNGFLDNIAVALLKTPSRLGSLAIVRGEEAGFSGPREIEIIRLLAPHLRKAISIADLIEMRELTARTFESSFDALSVPVILVDECAGVVHANKAARDVFAAGDVVRSEHGTLKSIATDASERLENAIVDATGEDGPEGPAARVVYLPRSDGQPSFAHVLPIHTGARGRIEPAATAAIFVTPAPGASSLPVQAWASAFGLTQTEGRVLGLLVEGYSAGEIAERLEVADTTVRTHIARLMEKAGVKRQSELMRLVMQLHCAPLVR
ncbi:helix-turn-helix transcriptional regulator [Methyloceanibacter sp.]|uniref:helix-turn-helix transcriptional regulator n=1 Tax=Methyloceanibacter sp. TaxID=1965321 RepID=UPI003D6D03EB